MDQECHAEKGEREHVSPTQPGGYGKEGQGECDDGLPECRDVERQRPAEGDGVAEEEEEEREEGDSCVPRELMEDDEGGQERRPEAHRVGNGNEGPNVGVEPVDGATATAGQRKV